MEMSNLFFAFDRQHHLRSVLFSFFFFEIALDNAKIFKQQGKTIKRHYGEKTV